MSFVVNKDTYFDTDEANNIVNDLYIEDDEEYVYWDSLSTEDKEKLIRRATNLIEKCTFLGYKKVNTQVLQYPRLIDGVEKECPLVVKQAIIEQAIKSNLYKGKEEIKLQSLGVKSYSVEGASISFIENASTTRLSNGIYKGIFDTYLSNLCYFE